METHVFKKTSNGHEEISSRRRGLTAGQRRLLLFIDGKRRLSEAIALASCDGLSDAKHLLATDLIEELLIIPEEEPPKKEADENRGLPFFMGDN